MTLKEFILAHSSEIIISLTLIPIYFITKFVLHKKIVKKTLEQNFNPLRVKRIRKIIGFSLLLIFAILLGLIWEISIKGISAYFASIITVIGVAFFATWSVVSNITSGIILFFFYPLKTGSKVRIVDGEEVTVGVVEGISLFSIHLITDDGKDLFYPNNLAIQKPMIHLNNE